MGGSESYASGINNAGQVVGEAQTSNGTRHATIWNGTTPTDLGTLGGNSSSALAINNVGQVVGNAKTSGGTFHATIWNGTTPTDLGTLGGNYSEGTAINDSGQVVGWASNLSESHHAVIWNGTTMIDLNDFLSVGEVSAGLVLQGAYGINDSGWIVGGGTHGAFLLVPIPVAAVPEPETYAMFMAGLGLMGFIARRRKNVQA